MPELEARLEALEAAVGTRRLIGRYALAYARADADTLASLYSATADERSRRGGGDPIAVGLESSLDPPDGVRIAVLHAGEPVISHEGGGRVRCHGYSYGEIERGTGARFAQAIHYGDDIRGEGSVWQFDRHRHHELFYGAGPGEDPTNLRPARWPEHDVGVGTLPYRWTTWAAWSARTA